MMLFLIVSNIGLFFWGLFLTYKYPYSSKNYYDGTSFNRGHFLICSSCKHKMIYTDKDIIKVNQYLFISCNNCKQIIMHIE